MSKYIDADMAKSCVENVLRKEKPGSITRMLLENTVEFIDLIPAADVVPVRHGKWLNAHHTSIVQCSLCGGTVATLWKGYFCQNCGAKMDVENDGTSKNADPLIAKGYAYTERFPFDGQPPKVMDVLRRRKE